MAGRNRSGSKGSGSNRSGSNRSGSNRSGSSRAGGNRSGGGPGQEARLAEIRRQNAADEKRRRAILLTTAAVVAALVAITAVAIWLAGRDGSDEQAGADPTGLTVVAGGDDAASGGVAVGEEGPVEVAVYLDYQCPNCRTYEEAYGGYLGELEQSDDVTVVYRPIAILDRVTGEGVYSSRSAGAAACVGEAGDDAVFSRFSELLFAEQPDEADAGTGLSDGRLAELAADAGAGEDVQQCVLDRTYVDWAGRSTAAAADAGITGTPTVTVDGEVVSNSAGGPPDPQQLQSAIDAAPSSSTTTEQEN